MNQATCRQLEYRTDAQSIAVPSAPELARQVALGEFSPEARAWLAEGFRRHCADGTPIETALRLDRASRVRIRDDALRAAAALLTLGEDAPWTVAGRLAAAVVRHERKRGDPSTPLEVALTKAFSTGVRVPSTARQLYAIILD